MSKFESVVCNLWHHLATTPSIIHFAFPMLIRVIVIWNLLFAQFCLNQATRDFFGSLSAIFLIIKSSSFPDYFSEKIILIVKIPAFLRAFKHGLSMFTTAQSGIWVELLVTSLQELGLNTQETSDWASNAIKTFLGYLRFIFLSKLVKKLYHLALQFGV